MSYNVLDDYWCRPTGDDLYLVSAATDGADVVSSRPDGTITYRNTGAGVGTDVPVELRRVRRCRTGERHPDRVASRRPAPAFRSPTRRTAGPSSAPRWCSICGATSSAGRTTPSSSARSGRRRAATRPPRGWTRAPVRCRSAPPSRASTTSPSRPRPAGRGRPGSSGWTSTQPATRPRWWCRCSTSPICPPTARR